VVPDRIPTRHAVFVEPLAAACRILVQAEIDCRSIVAVLGDGKLGLLVAQALNAKGARVVLFGRHRDKLRIAEERGVQVRLTDSPPRRWFQWVVDATGSAEGLATAMSMAEPGGRVIMKSTVHGPVTIDTAPVVVDELLLLGSRCGPFAPAIDLLAKRKVEVRSMLAAEFPLRDAAAAFDRAAEPGVLKVLLRMN
jgi:alcohol dehydrogenase